jgi:AcrR family transcriptional regulator
MTHIERRVHEKEKMRQGILDAAKAIAAKEGWQAVTIRKIADEIQYTPPIVYEYFENKEALFRELVYSGFDLLGETIERAKREEPDPRKLLRNLSLIEWDFAFSHAELFQLMFSLERHMPNEKMLATVRVIDDVFQELAGGDTEKANLLLVNWICLNHGAITVIMKMEPPQHFLGGATPREIFDAMIRRFIASL